MSQVIIYTNDEGGLSVVHPSGEVPIDQLVAAVVPPGTDYSIIDKAALPSDRLFRNAWTKVGSQVVEDLTKSQALAHEIRRKKREEEFKPYDEVIVKQIPGVDHDAAEAARAKIRDRYKFMQTVIDASTDVDTLRAILNS